MLKAIIIDDEKWARSIIRNLGQWHELGIEIVGEGENGIDGLQLVEKEHPDIVITDMQMSNMDGVDFLKTLKDKVKEIKIIVISGYDNFDYMRQAIHSQAIEYILKPVDAVELNEALKRCVKEMTLLKSTSTLALHDLFEEEVIVYIIEKVKAFRSVLKGTDKTKVTTVLADLKKRINYTSEDQSIFVRLLHDYLLPVLREEMMDVLKRNEEIRAIYDQLKMDVKEGMLINNYFERVEELTIAGINHRYNEIKETEKPIVDLAKEYIDVAYREEISLSDVAERFFISKEYLSSSFKSHYGITLGNYILKRKMEEAVKLLEKGNAHKEISKHLGYKDVTYFYKVFKKYYGCTPGEYNS
ncbi:response regulator transcription factor [Vallitalea maricola]|uniref:Uncharacterized protein n=1 Tax=Vallitalea maricola TaxID=3074433 RepID=A0ACB5UHD1_9FIRM|nr:hypothetical protein AN2V17_11940 [Vallitalea sp. AN17-2]